MKRLESYSGLTLQIHPYSNGSPGSPWGSVGPLGIPQARPWDPPGTPLAPPRHAPGTSGDAPGIPGRAQGSPWTMKRAIFKNVQRQELSIAASNPFVVTHRPNDPLGRFCLVYFENRAPFGLPQGRHREPREPWEPAPGCLERCFRLKLQSRFLFKC